MLRENSFRIFLLVVLCASVVKANVCSCPKHILCLYSSSSPGKNCIGHKSSGFSASEKKLAIEKINEYRSKVAMGREKLGSPGPQPSAADMIEVTWDDYLEKTSQRWSDQCIFEHSDNTCRVTELSEYFGENLAINSYSLESMYNETIFLEQIKNWYDEVKDFPQEQADKYEPWTQGKVIGHYAQLIYGSTYRVGCGRTRWAGKTMLVCHFKPGIYQSKPVYKRGNPASKCPEGSIKSRYEGLCALEKYSQGSTSRHSIILLSSLCTLIHFVDKCFI